MVECGVVDDLSFQGWILGVPTYEGVEAGVKVVEPSPVGAPTRRFKLEALDFLLKVP
jgi:hypothetical protein